jgi:glycosyltransferase involved in cell wall biosynthesis
MDASPELSLVVPAYNEEANVHAFLEAAKPVLDDVAESWEIVFVDDGSRDQTLAALAAAHAQDPRVRVVALARNFGKDVALSAGLAHASGRAVIPIDIDLQHPPSVIREFVAKWREGYEMVVGVRSRRDEEGFLRRSFSRLYYKVLGTLTKVPIPANAGDFRLLDRKVVDVINQMPERCRFMKGIFAWPGFKTCNVEFQAAERAAGGSTWSFWRLWRFALDGIFSFSTKPLLVWTYLGLLCAAGAFIYLTITVVQKVFWGIDAPGYASLLSVVLFFNGVLLMSNGIQGEYIARIFEEVKGRPLFVVTRTWGLPVDASKPTTASPIAVLAASKKKHDDAA